MKLPCGLLLCAHSTYDSDREALSRLGQVVPGGSCAELLEVRWRTVCPSRNDVRNSRRAARDAAAAQQAGVSIAAARLPPAGGLSLSPLL